MTMYGAVELGGTKCLVAFGTSGRDLTEPVRVDTADPDATFPSLIELLRKRGPEAVGVACFGPMELDERQRSFGTLLSTPKTGWSGENVYRRFADGLNIPVSLTTDVNAAALGEGRWGAATGMADFAYVTVGTGIGAGIVSNRSLIGGVRHPEMGHVPVSRLGDDRHRGICPFHGLCLEGMASGPALESRFGPPSTWAGNSSVLDVATHYLAQGLVSLTYTVAPERIIVGGGVSKLPGFHDRLRTKLAELMADYPETPDLDLLISPPGLYGMSALAGAVALAMNRSD